MRYFKKIILIVILLSTFSSAVFAGVQEEYERAKITYVNALVALATYSDRAGVIARGELAEAGWVMRQFNERFHGVDAKFFLVDNNALEQSKEVYILAVTGTENMHDVKTDLNFSKIFFGGGTPESFIEQAAKKDLTSKDPMVHRGFNQYTQAAFFTKEINGETYGAFLLELLQENKNRKLYMVGHSLGGAVVTLGAARLISMGADPAQIEIITFGAPAVGNSAFVEQYGAALPLQRVVMKGDPVKGVLQSIAGGYTQFGEQVVWEEQTKTAQGLHSIVIYADAANRNFYDARHAMTAAGIDVENTGSVKDGSPMVYISPLSIKMNAEIVVDTPYVRDAVSDYLRNSLSGFVIGSDERGSLSEELTKARAAGCQWLLQAGVRTEKVKNEQYAFHVDYQEDIYEVQSGEFKRTLVYTSGTRHFTPILAALYNVASARDERLQIINAE